MKRSVAIKNESVRSEISQAQTTSPRLRPTPEGAPKVRNLAVTRETGLFLRSDPVSRPCCADLIQSREDRNTGPAFCDTEMKRSGRVGFQMGRKHRKYQQKYSPSRASRSIPRRDHAINEPPVAIKNESVSRPLSHIDRRHPKIRRTVTIRPKKFATTAFAFMNSAKTPSS